MDQRSHNTHLYNQARSCAEVVRKDDVPKAIPFTLLDYGSNRIWKQILKHLIDKPVHHQHNNDGGNYIACCTSSGCKHWALGRFHSVLGVNRQEIKSRLRAWNCMGFTTEILKYCRSIDHLSAVTSSVRFGSQVQHHQHLQHAVVSTGAHGWCWNCRWESACWGKIKTQAKIPH